jgi:predicted acyltransferase
MMEEMATAAVTTAVQTERAITGPQRVLSVDLLRGLTIALMILVNDPGDWGHTFTQLDHAPWNGWTLTDLVFPTFLFLVGASIVFSMEARAARGNCRRTIAGGIFLRAAKLELLAWSLAFFPRMHWTMRLYGVLPRIAVCYLFGALIVLAARRKTWVLVGTVAAILVGYWVLLRFAAVPGAGHPVRDFPLLDKQINLAAWTDRAVSAWSLKWLHTGTLYQKTRDPEGLLSTLPAVATVLIGALVGMWMRRPSNPRLKGETWGTRTRSVMFAMGMAMFCAGAVWGRWFPINKNLWTSSYVLLSAGIATMVLALLNWLVDGRAEPWPRWLRVTTWPWFVFGSNAIAAFTVSVVLVKGLIFFKLTDSDGDKNSLWAAIYETVFSRNGSTEWTSLAFAASFVVVCFLPIWWLWRKKWFLKI